MISAPVLRYAIAGQLRREFILFPQGKTWLDKPGGNCLYAAAGLSVWDQGIGLLSKAGKNYPVEWLDDFDQHGMDISGIQLSQDDLDQRYFVAYTGDGTPDMDNPVAHFSRLEMQYPKSLLGYQPHPFLTDDLSAQPGLQTLQISSIPGHYLDTIAAHICPMDFLNQTILLSAFRQSHIHSVSLRIPEEYLNPGFWDYLPSVINGLTALHISEKGIQTLFKGRTSDIWEMAESLIHFGCETVVIWRGEEGQYVASNINGTHWMIPAYPAKTIDPTGMYDAFCGAYLAGYLAHYDPMEAALYGNISASLTVEGTGPFYATEVMPGLPQARLDLLRTMVRKV